MFFLGLTVYEHPLLKCLMLAQFGQQTRCCRFPFLKIEEWPWCRRPAIWAKPNSYFVTHPSQNGKRLQTIFIKSVRAHCCTGAFSMSLLPKTKQTLSIPRFGFGWRFRSVLALAPQNILFIFLREGWRGRFAFTGAMVGGGVCGEGGWRVPSTWNPKFWK